MLVASREKKCEIPRNSIAERLVGRAREEGVRTKLIAVTFSHELGRFDDAELAAFLRDRDVATFREHVVAVDGEPFLFCTSLDALFAAA